MVKWSMRKDEKTIRQENIEIYYILQRKIVTLWKTETVPFIFFSSQKILSFFFNYLQFANYGHIENFAEEKLLKK